MARAVVYIVFAAGEIIAALVGDWSYIARAALLVSAAMLLICSILASERVRL